MDQNNDIAGSMMALAIAGAALFLLVLLLASAVPASPSCLTKEEARARWPRDHLYWHTRQQCWDNRRAVHGPAKPKGVTQSTESSEENKKPPRTRWASGVRFVHWKDYNEIDAKAGPTAMRHKPLTAGEIDWLQWQDEVERRLQTCCWPAPPAFVPWQMRIEGSL